MVDRWDGKMMIMRWMNQGGGSGGGVVIFAYAS
jgi:hypothetical protein